MIFPGVKTAEVCKDLQPVELPNEGEMPKTNARISALLPTKSNSQITSERPPSVKSRVSFIEHDDEPRLSIGECAPCMYVIFQSEQHGQVISHIEPLGVGRTHVIPTNKGVFRQITQCWMTLLPLQTSQIKVQASVPD